MSDQETGERPVDELTPTDPFSFDDPEARAREERRLERERRRLERDQRRLGGGGTSGGRLKGVFGRKRRASGDGVPSAAPAEEIQPDARPITEESNVIEETTGRAARPSTADRLRAGMRRRLRGRPSTAAIRRRRILAVVVVAILALLIWFLLALFQPFGGEGKGKVVVTIPKGATATQVGEILKRKGVISDGPPFVSGSTLFRWRLAAAGKSDEIPSGSYTLGSGMSYGAAIDELTASPAERGITVVVPEGYMRDEIAGVAEDAGLKGNYMKESLASNQIDLKRYGAGGANSLEGFLFPATYELKPSSSAEDLVDQQLKAFERNFKKVDLKYARSKNLSPYDVLIIASMIDREVQVPGERKIVAEVIYNRLAANEPLGIDATIRYATGNFDKPLTESELSTDSPYNTRLVAGLPPTPIGNPGLGAIEAAADPGRGDNRWFVVKPGTCGEHVFADTEAEFNQAADRYQRALERQGESPTKC
jgi:peptidoglycan lytic transglycosylase G